MQSSSFPIPLSVDPQLNPRKSFLNGTADSDEYGDTADESPPLHFFARLAFLLAEMLVVMLFINQSPWSPARMIAAMVLGREVLRPPADFDAAIVMSAMAVHFPLSILYGLAAGWIVHWLNNTNVLLIGGAFGLAIYLMNFYLIAPAAFSGSEKTAAKFICMPMVATGPTLDAPAPSSTSTASNLPNTSAPTSRKKGKALVVIGPWIRLNVLAQT
jgi:hypothetical protein